MTVYQTFLKLSSALEIVAAHATISFCDGNITIGQHYNSYKSIYVTSLIPI